MSPEGLMYLDDDNLNAPKWVPPPVLKEALQHVGEHFRQHPVQGRLKSVRGSPNNCSRASIGNDIGHPESRPSSSNVPIASKSVIVRPDGIRRSSKSLSSVPRDPVKHHKLISSCSKAPRSSKWTPVVDDDDDDDEIQIISENLNKRRKKIVTQTLSLSLSKSSEKEILKALKHNEMKEGCVTVNPRILRNLGVNATNMRIKFKPSVNVRKVGEHEPSSQPQDAALQTRMGQKHKSSEIRIEGGQMKSELSCQRQIEILSVPNNIDANPQIGEPTETRTRTENNGSKSIFTTNAEVEPLDNKSCSENYQINKLAGKDGHKMDVEITNDPIDVEQTDVQPSKEEYQSINKKPNAEREKREFLKRPSCQNNFSKRRIQRGNIDGRTLYGKACDIQSKCETYALEELRQQHTPNNESTKDLDYETFLSVLEHFDKHCPEEIPSSDCKVSGISQSKCPSSTEVQETSNLEENSGYCRSKSHNNATFQPNVIKKDDDNGSKARNKTPKKQHLNIKQTPAMIKSGCFLPEGWVIKVYHPQSGKYCYISPSGQKFFNLKSALLTIKNENQTKRNMPSKKEVPSTVKSGDLDPRSETSPKKSQENEAVEEQSVEEGKEMLAPKGRKVKQSGTLKKQRQKQLEAIRGQKVIQSMDGGNANESNYSHVRPFRKYASNLNTNQNKKSRKKRSRKQNEKKNLVTHEFDLKNIPMIGSSVAEGWFSSKVSLLRAACSEEEFKLPNQSGQTPSVSDSCSKIDLKVTHSREQNNILDLPDALKTWKANGGYHSVSTEEAAKRIKSLSKVTEEQKCRSYPPNWLVNQSEQKLVTATGKKSLTVALAKGLNAENKLKFNQFQLFSNQDFSNDSL